MKNRMIFAGFVIGMAFSALSAAHNPFAHGAPARPPVLMYRIPYAAGPHAPALHIAPAAGAGAVFGGDILGGARLPVGVDFDDDFHVGEDRPTFEGKLLNEVCSPDQTEQTIVGYVNQQMESVAHAWDHTAPGGDAENFGTDANGMLYNAYVMHTEGMVEDMIRAGEIAQVRKHLTALIRLAAIASLPAKVAEYRAQLATIPAAPAAATAAGAGH